MSTAINQELVVTAVLYASIGAVYGASGYVKHVLNGERELKPKKFGKTLLVGAVAGAIVALQGDDFTVGAFEAVMVIAVPVVDQIWNGATGGSTDTDAKQRV